MSTPVSMPSGPTPGAIWLTVLPGDAEIRAARRRLHGKAVVIAALLAASYYALVLSELPVIGRILAAAVLVLALVALGTNVMHDSNHGSFSRRKWVNRTLAYTSDALGASSWLWRIQHNQLHHGNTNVPGFDADLELAPWARLAPTQPWRRRFRWQHIYIWPLYGLLSIKNLLVSDALSLINGEIGQQPIPRRANAGVVARVVAGKLVHLTWALAIPLMFNPWLPVLIFYMACSWMVGFVLAMIFQLAHCVDEAQMASLDTPRRGNDFAAHQLNTTVDIASPLPVFGHLFRWLVGGLDHQVEHHLAPGLPHTIYPKLARRFREACDRHGVTCRVHAGVWPAIRSHVRWLKAMGANPRMVSDTARGV